MIGINLRPLKPEGKPFDPFSMSLSRTFKGFLALALVAVSANAGAVTVAANDATNPWLSKRMTRDELLPQIKSAASYLARQQLADGQFVYLNDPRGKARKRSGDKYSLIRHLGSVYALLRAHEQSPDPAFITAARRGLDFALGFVGDQDGVTSLKGINGKPSLGENGFLVLDLALYAKLQGPNFAKDRDVTERLASFVDDHLEYGNEFSTKEQWAECQAAMGLILYQETFGLPKDRARSFVSTVEKWLIAARKDGRRTHWSIQAAAWLGRARPNVDKLLLEEGLLAGHSQLEGVYDKASAGKTTRLVGAKNGKLNSCNATARNEGLIAAHVIAKRLFRTDEASYFLNRVKEHLAFAMQFQYGAAGNLYEKDPLLSRLGRLFGLGGGVFDSPQNGSVRIDYVSHHIRAMTAFLQATGDQR